MKPCPSPNTLKSIRDSFMIRTLQNGKHVSSSLKGDGGDKPEPTTEISFLWLQERRIDSNTSSTGKATKQRKGKTGREKGQLTANTTGHRPFIKSLK